MAGGLESRIPELYRRFSGSPEPALDALLAEDLDITYEEVSGLFSACLTEAVLKAYEPSGKNGAQAVRLLAEQGIKTSNVMVIRLWRKAGYEIAKRGGARIDGKDKRSEERRRMIVGLYERYNGSPSLAAQSLPYSVSSIKRVWKAAGLIINTSRYI